jgi:hypothetical protein
MKVGTCFGVDANPVGTGLDKLGDMMIGIRNHQVAIQRHGGNASDGLNKGRAKRDWGDEVPVHHVDVEYVGAGMLTGENIAFNVKRVSRKQGRSDAYHLPPEDMPI